MAISKDVFPVVKLVFYFENVINNKPIMLLNSCFRLALHPMKNGHYKVLYTVCYKPSTRCSDFLTNHALESGV